MPDKVLRWLWRDYPRSVDDPNDDSNRTLLVPKETPASESNTAK